jgi:hypothetical protein
VTPTTIPNFFTNILYYQDQELVQSWFALVFVVVVFLLGITAYRIYRKQNTQGRQGYALIIALAFVPVALLFILSMPPFRSSFVDRYLVPSTVGISLFIGVTLALGRGVLHPGVRRFTVVLVSGAMIVGMLNVYSLGNYNKTLHSSNNTRQVIDEIASHGREGEPIIADSPWLFYEAVFYSTSRHPVYFIDASTDYKYGSLDMLRKNDQHKIKDLPMFTGEHTTLWYLGRPGDNPLSPPVSTWRQLQQVTVNDSVSGKPSYKAVQYQAN